MNSHFDAAMALLIIVVVLVSLLLLSSCIFMNAGRLSLSLSKVLDTVPRLPRGDTRAMPNEGWRKMRVHSFSVGQVVLNGQTRSTLESSPVHFMNASDTSGPETSLEDCRRQTNFIIESVRYCCFLSSQTENGVFNHHSYFAI